MYRYLKFTNRRLFCFYYSHTEQHDCHQDSSQYYIHTDCKIIKTYVKIPPQLKIH